MHFFKSFTHYCAFILLSFIVISCTNTNPTKQQNALENWQTRQQQLSQITTFQVNGSIAYFSKSTKHYGRFFIAQTNNENYRLKLTSPIGTTIFSLEVKPTIAIFTNNDGKTYKDYNVERLIDRLTGIKMPLKSLHQWLKGLSSNPQYDQIDNQGRLINTQLTQNDQTWAITINKYATYSQRNNAIDLPANIELKQKNDIARFTINNWVLN